MTWIVLAHPALYQMQNGVVNIRSTLLTQTNLKNIFAGKGIAENMFDRLKISILVDKVAFPFKAGFIFCCNRFLKELKDYEFVGTCSSIYVINHETSRVQESALKILLIKFVSIFITL